MYSIYFYNDWTNRRTSSQYGFWTGKSYIYQGELFPVSATFGCVALRKWYKSLKRAIDGAEKALEKYGYVTAYDIEDENGNIVYKSHPN